MTQNVGAALEVEGRDHHRAGEYVRALTAYEAAFRAHRRDGDVLAGARAARTVAWFRGWIFGEWAVAAGMAGTGPEPARTGRGRGALEGAGWILLDQARAGSDLDAQRQLYLAAVDLARRCGDPDLECEATASLGMMLVFSGHVADGMARLDEALASICGGEVQELPVVEGCLCGLLHACEHTLDVGRAEQWLRAAEDVFRRQALVMAAGYCRAHYAGILLAAGRWREAERELDAALRLLPDNVAVRDEALCRLADLRVRQGRLEDAADLLEGLAHHEAAVRPQAALHLARQHPELAIDLLERALITEDLEEHVVAPLLALSVEANLAAGATHDAVDASARLTEIARGHPSPYIRAIAATARARTCVATGTGDARAGWHQAITMFAEARMPAELARCRLELARTVASERPDVARLEATAALDAFDQLGVDRGVDDAAAFLRSIGGPGRTGPKRRSALTQREDDVLELLGHGLTNVEIGERLFISPKTVEHHVSRILSKLGVRSRTEAAAVALRGAGSGPP